MAQSFAAAARPWASLTRNRASMTRPWASLTTGQWPGQASDPVRAAPASGWAVRVATRMRLGDPQAGLGSDRDAPAGCSESGSLPWHRNSDYYYVTVTVGDHRDCHDRHGHGAGQGRR